MNKQEILNMEPGYELDRLVYERVLESEDAEKEQSGWTRFSSDSSTIWRIVEAMINKGFLYSVMNGRDGHTCIFDSMSTHRRYVVHGKTPMEAICKASLLASIM